MRRIISSTRSEQRATAASTDPNMTNNRLRRRRPHPSYGATATVLATLTICFCNLTTLNRDGVFFVAAYHRAPCKKLSVRRQFQFTDCYVPYLNPDLYLSEASFVMAHDAATGYLNINGNAESDGSGSSSEYSNEYDGVDNMNNAGGGYNNGGDVDNDNGGNNFNGNTGWNSITMKLLSLYGKTQVGTVYDQLNDGARALDLRPKIYSNGTVGFHHGSLIDIH